MVNFPDDNVPEVDLSREFLNVVEPVLARLPGRYRQALLLAGLSDQGGLDAARILGLSTLSLSRRLACARQLLRRRLESRRPAQTPSPSAPDGQPPIPEALVDKTVRRAVAIAAGRRNRRRRRSDGHTERP
jgi:hypothetical protein